MVVSHQENQDWKKVLPIHTNVYNVMSEIIGRCRLSYRTSYNPPKCSHSTNHWFYKWSERVWPFRLDSRTQLLDICRDRILSENKPLRYMLKLLDYHVSINWWPHHSSKDSRMFPRPILGNLGNRWYSASSRWNNWYTWTPLTGAIHINDVFKRILLLVPCC